MLTRYRYVMERMMSIVGRANVGKSSVYNRLLSRYGTGERALVGDHPGTTRDGKSFYASELGLSVKDTPPSTVQERSEISLLVVDGTEGVTPLDRSLAKQLRDERRETVLVANKSEGDQSGIISDLYELDLGEPVFVSCCGSLGWQDLHDRITSVLRPTGNDEPSTTETKYKIGFLGRANTGKSTLFNALVRDEKAKTDAKAGTTTDVVEAAVGQFVLLDTAGVSRKWRQEALETRRALRQADVVVVVMDAWEILQGGEGLSRQEMSLGKEASDLGKCVMVVVNKWDLVPQSKQTLLRKAVEEKTLSAFAQVKGMPVIFASAKTGLNVPLILSRAERLLHKWEKRISTSELNAWLRAFVVHHPVPWKDKMMCHVKFITQVGIKPPTFVIYTNIHGEFPDNYLQLLKNTMRDEFKLQGPPLVLLLRSTFVPKKVMKAKKFAPKKKTEQFFDA